MNVAIMTGKMLSTMQRSDKADVVTADALVTQVWVRSGERWKLASFHACRSVESGRS
jgi:hypothetical protein